MIKFIAILVIGAFTFSAHTANGQATRSIREFATCDGKTDDSIGVAKAFDAAKNGAFKLEVDAPVFIHIGMDVARPIFVSDKTDVDFSGGGLFIVDNATIPAFVIANSKEITFTNWRVEYTGSYPINWLTGGYYNNGAFVPSTGKRRLQRCGIFAMAEGKPWHDFYRCEAGLGRPCRDRGHLLIHRHDTKRRHRQHEVVCRTRR